MQWVNELQTQTTLDTYFLPTNLIPSCFPGSFGKEILINSGKKYIFQIKDNVFGKINFFEMPRVLKFSASSYLIKDWRY